ncbi:MAG: hypothetical protein KY443_03255 [Actinobacteria bacterium]|nr:hypothetical protein [Actinomycetota bacterium]
MSRATDAENAEAAEAWVDIARSPFCSVYLHEMYWLAVEVVEGCEATFDAVALPVDRGKAFITVDQSVHRRLHNVLGAAARLRALLLPRQKNPKQTDGEARVQRFRARWLQDDMLGGIALEPVLDADVRHSIEHFDEYVDRVALRARAGEFDLPILVPLDVCLTYRDQMKVFTLNGRPAPTYLIRCYVASERRYINCGVETALEPLAAACRAIRDRLSQHVPVDETGRGSPMLVITAQSFGAATPPA